METYKDFIIYFIPEKKQADDGLETPGYNIVAYLNTGKDRIRCGWAESEEKGLALAREHIDYEDFITNFQPAEGPELSNFEKKVAQWIYETHGGVVSEKQLREKFHISTRYSHQAMLMGERSNRGDAILVKWFQVGYMIHTQYDENILTPKILPFIGQ